MASFTATYTSSRGESRQINLDAPDLLTAKRQLRRRGIRATSLAPAGASPGRPGRPAPRSGSPVSSERATPGGLTSSFNRSSLARLLEARPGVREKAVFANKLSALVDAGIPIVRSLDLMARQQTMPLFRRAIEAVGMEINQGGSLGAAMRRWPTVFDRLSIAMVEAGEAGGVLDESLKRLAKLLEDNAKLQNQIRGAMGYPIAVLVIAVLVFLGMTIFLIPTFAGIFEELGAELPAFTQFMVNLSKLMRSSAALLLAGGLAIGVWLFSRYYTTPSGRRQVDAVILKLPLFGDLIQKTATAKFCRTFSSLTRAGVPILMSLEIVYETAGNTIIGDAILSARQDVLEGIPLSNALIRRQVFPEMAMSMLAIGEETGELDTMLSKVADFYEDEVAAAVKSLTSMLEPALIVLVGVIVGSILLAMYLPMFTVFDQIK